MELLQLKYLCTAARFENFSRAARHHKIPQSAISKTIAQLERELGVQLFLRKGNRVMLSEAGKRFTAEVQTALSTLEDATRVLRGERGEMHGELRIAAEEHHAALLREMRSFRAANPGVSFSLSRMPDPAFDYDLRIAAVAQTTDRLGSLPLRDARVQVLLPAGHRLCDWDRIPATALAKETLVACARRTSAEEAAAALLSRLGVSVPLGLLCDSPAALLSYVSDGMGIAFVSDVSEREASSAGAVLRPFADGNPACATCLSWRRQLSPLAISFARALCLRLGTPATVARAAEILKTD